MNLPIRCKGAFWLSFQSPESSGEIRPFGVTAVASTMVSAVPRRMNCARCAKCQSVRWPSCALYWHIGATANRFCSVRPRICRGWKSVGADAGSNAVPAGGSCAGVKNGAPVAALFAIDDDMVALILVTQGGVIDNSGGGVGVPSDLLKDFLRNGVEIRVRQGFGG